MDKHIVSLLKQKNRVIIPELGAFIVKQSTPKTFVFNEFLKYNDGMLIEHVMNEENITKEEATSKVDDFVIDVNSKLNIGEEYTIDGLGTLKKDRGGKIQFQTEDASSTAPLYADEKEKKPETQKPKDQKEEPKKQEETPMELIEEPEKKTGDKEEKSESDKKDLSSKKKETPPPVTPPVQNEEKQVPEQKNVPSSKKDERVIKPAAEKRKPTPTYKQQQGEYQPPLETPKRNSKSIIWTLLIVLAVIAIGVWVYMNRDFIRGDKQENFSETVLGPDEEQVTGQETETPAEQDPTVEEQQPTQDVPEEPIVQEQQPIVEEQQQTAARPEESESKPAAKQYYIVAGCFQNENNAVDYASYLREQGYDAQKFGKYSGLHAVSFNAFTDYNEALRELNKIRKNVEPEAWILYY